MDGLKLDKWRENFSAQIQSIEIEFNAFFLSKKLEQYYTLEFDEISQGYILVITDETLPKEIKERLEDALVKSLPEDSV